MHDIFRLINNLYARHGLAQLNETGTSLDELTVVTNTEMKTIVKDHVGKVQVITPLGPCHDFLMTAANSVTSQTQPNDWWLVVDGASPGCGTFTGLPPSQPRLVSEIAMGVYGARNEGLKHVYGDFITVHDADDWSHPQKLEMQVKALLDNPNAVASVSHWARCTTDMQLETRPDGTVVHRNVSSLLIRKAVFERLGYWDRVSVNADTEYYYRILAAYGPNSIVEVLPGVPLALGRRHEDSLTMHPQTHWKTQFGGVRKEYMDSAHEWHKKCAQTGNWFMPYAPPKRPFPAPELIDRPVLELADRVWPHIHGDQLSSDEMPCILLCGHAAGAQQFGAERSLLDLAKAINNLGYRLIVTLPQRNMAYLDRLKPLCTDILLLPSPWQQQDEVWKIALAAYIKLLQHFKIDLVHVNTLVNRVPMLAARQLGIKTVLHVRELLDWDLTLRQAMGKDIKSESLLQTDLLLANSTYTAMCVTKSGFDGTLRTVTNTVELEGIWQVRRFVSGEIIRVGMISSNLPKKGLDDFIAVAIAAKAMGLPLQFNLIGPVNDYTRALEKNMPDNICFPGYSSSSEQALIQLDILLNLSHFQESFGRTVAEAMLAGKPVIGYRWGALPDIIKNGYNGFLVHLGDIEGIVQRLAYFCRQPELMEEFGYQGQQLARQCFNQHKFQDQLAAAYSLLL